MAIKIHTPEELIVSLSPSHSPECICSWVLLEAWLLLTCSRGAHYFTISHSVPNVFPVLPVLLILWSSQEHKKMLLMNDNLMILHCKHTNYGNSTQYMVMVSVIRYVRLSGHQARYQMTAVLTTQNQLKFFHGIWVG